jgi:hypothetical protein
VTKAFNSNIFKRWLPAIAVMAVIFAFSAIPGKALVEAGLGKESYHVNGHFFLYLLLTIMYYKATGNVKVALLLSIVYAFSDEFHQNFVPLRSVSLKDLITDFVASFVAALFLWKYQYTLPLKLRNWLNT